MPIRLVDLRKETRTVTFSYKDEDVTVVYRPGLVTSTRRMRLLYGSTAYLSADKPRARDVMGGWKSYHEDLAELIESWDVEDENGKACAPTADLLEQFPQAFINALVEAMVDDHSTDPQNGKPSEDTLKPKD